MLALVLSLLSAARARATLTARPRSGGKRNKFRATREK